MVIRPEDIDIVPVEQGQLVGTVTSVTFKGMQYDIIVDFRGFKWLIQTTDHSPEGARIGVKIDPAVLYDRFGSVADPRFNRHNLFLLNQDKYNLKSSLRKGTDQFNELPNRQNAQTDKK